MSEDKPSSYSEAGVDRDQEEEAVKSILELIKSTHQGDTLMEGHFAGSIELGDQIISIANDGVGSKVILAQELDDLTTIGVDCVAMCVNDLITVGSIPAAFVDYIAIRRPEEESIRDIVKGLVDGCLQANIPLVGGETATLPEVITAVKYGNGFDVAGTAIGIHHKSETISGASIKPGDKIIGITSSGIHSNGLTLARQLVSTSEDRLKLLEPTRIYVRAIKDLLDQVDPHGMAHITGGGLTNLFRLGEYHYQLDKLNMISRPEIFDTIQNAGDIDTTEMYRTFNNGLGFVVIVDEEDVEITLRILNNHYPSYVIGEIKEGDLITANIVDDVVSFKPEDSS